MKELKRTLRGIRQMRQVGVILMQEFPYASPQWATGYQMTLCGLSMRNALTDPEWDATAVLHAKALVHNAKAFLEPA